MLFVQNRKLNFCIQLRPFVCFWKQNFLRESLFCRRSFAKSFIFSYAIFGHVKRRASVWNPQNENLRFNLKNQEPEVSRSTPPSHTGHRCNSSSSSHCTVRWAPPWPTTGSAVRSPSEGRRTSSRLSHSCPGSLLTKKMCSSCFRRRSAASPVASFG